MKGGQDLEFILQRKSFNRNCVIQKNSSFYNKDLSENLSAERKGGYTVIISYHQCHLDVKCFNLRKFLVWKTTLKHGWLSLWLAPYTENKLFAFQAHFSSLNLTVRAELQSENTSLVLSAGNQKREVSATPSFENIIHFTPFVT